MTTGAAAIKLMPVDLQPAERILLARRRHRVYLAWKLFPPVLLALLSLLAIAVILGVSMNNIVAGILLALAIVFFGTFVIRAYFVWFRYQNDVWVVTDQRIIDSLKKHWFHHHVASADLVDVEDMSIQKEGFLATVFNFGNVRCQTAGITPNFVLAGIPNPTETMTVIDGARDAARKALGRPG